MTVDPDCSVAISSLSEGECSPTTATNTADLPTVAEDLGDKNITPIIAGAVTAVVVVVVLIIAVTIIGISFIVLKKHHGELSLKETDQK